MKYQKNYMIRLFIFLFAMMALLVGCVSQKTPEAPVVVKDEDVMLFLEPGLRPESLLFPEYLFLEGLELDQHGLIPGTLWIGAGLKTATGLKTILRQYNKVLATEGWQVTKAEIATQSFRLMAVKNAEMLEIRATQGTGPTQLFILYQPGDRASPAQQERTP